MGGKNPKLDSGAHDINEAKLNALSAPIAIDRQCSCKMKRFTATGFPRVFYLRYHGYPIVFPLWALARYRNLRRANDRRVAFGM